MKSNRVIQALDAFARVLTTTSRLQRVYVVVAVAGLAGATRHAWVAMIILRTTITVYTRVASKAITDRLTSPCIQSAGICVLKPGTKTARAHTRTATVLRPGTCVSIVTIGTS